MASLKCLACGHNNKVGDESCASCSSSLNLRLCSACEAINANNAERCHSCGAQFGPETTGEALIEEKVLPAAWVAGAKQAVLRGRRITVALWLAPALAAAALAYYFYATPGAAPKHVAAAQAAPVEKTSPATLVKTGPVTTLKTGPVTVPAVETKTAVEPKRTLAPVTHTRGADVAPPRTQPTPAAVSEPAPVALERRIRVTHTKGEAAAPVEPAAAPKSEAPVCAPSVFALGLCKGN